ncbi:MAG: glycoside hydrolase family 99-like domain-containing protein, partial [Anaerolineae bacterium]|nr:glycoside hydrolase family 99-like domain-containing protein [Anaerolineae bacterium]
MPIIIIGMHRSGTSMITRLLHTCGVYLGLLEDLTLLQSDDNPEGYWEHAAIMHLNEEILEHFGGSWDHPPNLQPGWSEDPTLKLIGHRFDGITAEFNKHIYWGWKDPRNSLTLEFWLKHIPDLKILLCLRNPLEVADSLTTGAPLREMNWADALHLWGEYHESILQQDIVDRLVVTHYEAYFYDPEAELRRILKALEIEASDDQIATAIATIKPDLKRQHVPSALLRDETVPDAIRQYYNFLCTCAGDVFAELRADPAYLLDTTNTYTTRLYQKIHQSNAQLSRQRETLTDRDRQIKQQQQMLADRDRQIEEQQHILADRDRQIEQQRQALLEHERQTQNLQISAQVLPKLTSVALNGFRYRRLQLSKIFKVAGKLSNFWSIQRVTRAVQRGKLEIPALFDADWYLHQYPEVYHTGMHPYVHFWLFGWYYGYQPMPLFDIDWYVAHYPDFNDEWANPLEHYERVGRYIGYRPCALFDPQWYLAEYPDVKHNGIDPLVHYCYTGWREGRNPSPEFDTNWYLRQYPDVKLSGVNPLHHYIQQGHREKRPTSPLSGFAEQSGLTLSQSPYVIQQELEESFLKASDLPTYQINQPRLIANPAVKLIALYLPQFHPTDINDEFWGKGFTEWTNVTRARPLFEGHYQPRLPGGLGFYDLRVIDTLREQAQLAREHGIAGFCIYRYWFNGKTVLDTPLELLYQHKDIDIEYCLCWANENWTRRWDGMDQEMLLAQEHTPEDDLAFIADAERFFHDDRYIRIDGKPLLMLYNIRKLPDPEATAQRWRTFCEEKGYPGLYLVFVATFGYDVPPADIGFDMAMQMPPHGSNQENVASRYNFFVDFEGGIYDYDAFANAYVIPNPADSRIFRTVSPGWDNTPRRGKQALIVANGSAEKYKRWLRSAIALTLKENTTHEQVIFINAWNEWAEGAYLEPDRRYGYATLNATSRTLAEFSSTDIIVVAPNAARAGSQIVLLHLIDWLVRYTYLNIKIILEEGGVLLDQYRATAPTLVLDELERKGFSDEQLIDEIKNHCGKQVGLIYSNTCIPGKLINNLPYEAPVISHIHELETSIRQYCADSIKLVRERTNHFIAVSPPVAKLLHEQYYVNPDAISLINEFAVVSADHPDKIRKQEILRGKNARIVWGCGTVSLRKGFDIFVNVAKHVHNLGIKDVQFCWMGSSSEDFPDVVQYIHQQGAEDIVTYLGEKENPRAYFPVGDIFFLASREDPHPLVVLEAADCSLPTVCFAETGGTPDFVSDDAGVVVPRLDEAAAARSIVNLQHNPREIQLLGQQAHNKLSRKYSRAITAPRILETIHRVAGSHPKV